ncbi:MAG TPA: hypothetical protein PK649_06045 [Vicingus sp.]|nr:hypothetical protein [Vicingus sp.]
MKTIKTVAIVTILFNHATAQEIELPRNNDSIIKNEINITVEELKQELALLQLNAPEVFHRTATAHYVYMDKGDIKSALKDMENNINFDEWVMKYPNNKLETNLLVVKTEYALPKYKKSTNYTSLPSKKRLPHSIISKNDLTTSEGKWVINYSPKNKYSDEFLIGFFFTSNFGFESIEEHFPKIIAYGNAIEEKSSNMINNFNNESALNRILSFLEKLIDVCAAIVINYNNPDIIRYAVANVLVPKMVKSSNGFQK